MLSNLPFLRWLDWLISGHSATIAAVVALAALMAAAGVVVLAMHWGETVRVGRLFTWTRRRAPPGSASAKARRSNIRQTELPS